MKCIIVDDEPLAREGMKLNVDEVDSLELIGQFSNAISAKDFVKNNAVDLIFLDIEMPEMTGIEFLRTMPDRPFVILTTAYPQFALEAYELDVIDYLVKPIRMDRFRKAINKALQFHDSIKEEKTVESKADDCFFIRSERKLIRLYFEDILYIKGMKDYVMIFSKDSKFMTAMNVKTIYDQLPKEHFFRISKSYIVNVNAIDVVEHDIVLLKDLEIPLGRTYKEEFLKKYIANKIIERK